jgi:mRNA deadenylase 3'-5' endonuclease subunit Ccr4
MVKIISYNVLCSVLSNKNVFPLADESHINSKNRLIKIKELFVEFMKDHSIICLQELGRQWYCDLINFFNENDYILVYMSYGFYLNDYMGVAIAYPKNFKVNKIDAIATSNFVPQIKKPNKKLLFLLNILKNNFLEILYYLLNMKLPTIKLTSQELISKNENVLLMIEFAANNKIPEFAVCTYHMPLWIDYRKSFTQIISQNIIKLCKLFSDKPFFITGDFNSLPRDDAINVFKENNFKTNENELITCFPKSSSTFDGKNVREFKEQIDYIFYENNKVECESLITFSKNLQLINTPNELDPSDHLPLIGEFTIKSII